LEQALEAAAASYGGAVARGPLFSSLPNGGWSVTTEFHFYLILPLLLRICDRSRSALAAAILFAVLLRTALFLKSGQVQTLAYWTLVGRFDQFAFGILAYKCRAAFVGRHTLAVLTMLGFMLFLWQSDADGDFYGVRAAPSTNPFWIFRPAVEGACYALCVAWYDSSFRHSLGPFSRLIATIGSYSYSIYLLHFFFVFSLARFLHRYVLDLSNIYVALAAALVAFLATVPLGYASYRWIESPFLRRRSSYFA
jgi:peptidoglycan/LPS O-acetylase OafA/YrhL